MFTIASCTGPAGMLVSLLLATVVFFQPSEAKNEREPSKVGCYAEVTPGRTHYKIGSIYDSYSNSIDEVGKFDGLANELVKCHDGRCHDDSSTKCRRAISKIRGARAATRAATSDSKSRWEHDACYMVTTRPFILVRVHSGPWPDPRWAKNPVDKNGFEHKLCHYDQCNSLSINTCKRLLKHLQDPDGWMV